ncbi:hypothetical protein A5gp_00026 [Alteromonas phage vB_AemP_PT15-A5]|nr:hypothetical protein A5gp_00026 [Alteromonas phage vB_AemP_PT15-A5]
MGLFSSKTVVQVAASVTPLVTDRPNLARLGVLKAIFGNTDITSTMLTTMLAGYNIEPNRIYNFAKDTDNYFLGLPASTKPEPEPKLDAVEEIILALENATVADLSIDSVAYRTPTTSDRSNYLLQEVSEYDPANEWYTSLPNLPEGYVAIVNSVTETELNPPGQRDEFDWLDPNEFHYSYSITRFDPNDRANTEEDVTLALATGDLPTTHVNDWGSRCYVAKYTVRKAGFYNEERIFVYDPYTDLYPELAIFPDLVLEGEYMPIVPLRLNKEFITEDSTINTHYARNIADIDRMLELLTLDREDLQENLATNPDIDDIQASYITFSIPIGVDFDLNSVEKQGTLEYLERYFYYLLTQQKVDKEAYLADTDLYNAISVRDGGLNTYLHWNYIEVYDGTYDPESLKYRLEWEIETEDINAAWFQFTFYNDDGLRLEVHDHKTQTCKVIHVRGLYHISDIYKGKQEVTRIVDAFHPVEDKRANGFFIPLNYNILRQLPNAKQTAVALDSLSLVNYAVQKTKVKWYERGAFAILVTIIIVVIAVITQNYALLASGAITASQVAILILQSLLVSVITGALLKPILQVLIDIFGIEFVAVIAAVLAVLGFVDASGIADLSSTLPSAEVLLQASTQLSTAVTDAIGQEIVTLQEDYMDFLKEVQSVQDEIDEILETFNANSFMSDLVMQTKTYESPEQFFRRTNTIDIGLMSLDTIEYFYDNALNINERY